ncbi:piRNA biogenesis protein EXD1 isoform X1 [Columba livia]|uniref:Exonuclease 3'-5' domain containing 1 n=1 Tax=Columba livia TaxID=8932 RepID=A0A2I0MND2_COLLI|nr:piRNA biogenesis protein EXD1 isoform X1 [Columba livia]PKK31192.1 exonuclease 3'-5' domain containing 1 [Columba livia]
MALNSERFASLVGRTVRVTLKCGVFQGVLQHVNRDRSLLLRTVKNLETGRSTRGVKMFFDHEIVNVELLDELDSGKGTALLSEFNKPHGDIITVRPPKNNDPHCAYTHLQKEETSFIQGYPKEIITCLTGARAHSRIYPEANHSLRRRCTSAVEGNKQADLEPADCGPWSSPCISLESLFRDTNSLKYSLSEKKKGETVEYIVVDCLQQKFGPAVLQLKQQHVVSVAGEGVNLSRYGKLSWLEVATKSCIFLFDIFLLGPRAFKNGLQMVLEDKNILKVMHDCRWISDCLFHQYGVLLFNVFDTQVADALQFSMATGGFLPHRVCTLHECLVQHLKIPSKWGAIMKCTQQMASENPDMWFLRPFPASLLEALALKAMLLLLLHSSLMDSLMSDLTAVVHDYLNVYRTGSRDHLGSTKPICMELPEELRQLADIQKLRREKAIKEYRMNEDGLLIRPAMELKERDDLQKDGNYRDDGDCFPTNKVVSQITPFFNEGLLLSRKA